MAHTDGVRLKKKFGQHFLHDYDILASIISHADLTEQDAILEIGCGNGFLTAALLDCPIKKLWSFEIDPEWAEKTESKIVDDRFTLFLEDFLTADITNLSADAPWKIVANIPYNITFPILEIVRKNNHLFSSGILMVQEEVAQKLAKKACSGKDYGFISLFYQHYFHLRLLDKVHPDSFVPAPKVTSRLLAFTVKKEITPIPQEDAFWEFIKACFKQPRRTLRNNLQATVYQATKLDDAALAKRAQQLNIQELMLLWHRLCG